MMIWHVAASLSLAVVVLAGVSFSFHAYGATAGGAESEHPTPELVSVVKIWDQGEHNAFTDLIRFQGKWFCTFREAEGHVKGDGKIRILTSAEGDTWTSTALLAEKGIDLRDPKLSVTPDNRLMVLAGGSVYREGELVGRRPRVAFSRNGYEWQPLQRILREGDWLWRVTWHEGRAYGTTYLLPQPGADQQLELMVSDDGVQFEPIAAFGVPGKPNETTLRFMPDGELIALVRRESGSQFGWIGTSRPPYTDWAWQESAHRLGGPNFIRLQDGSLWAGTRSYPGGARCVLARMTRDSIEPALELPSGGDCSYPGLVWHDGLLWMSYYASHEGKTSIYLAKIRMAP